MHNNRDMHSDYNKDETTEIPNGYILNLNLTTMTQV